MLKAILRVHRKQNRWRTKVEGQRAYLQDGGDMMGGQGQESRPCSNGFQASGSGCQCCRSLRNGSGAAAAFCTRREAQ